MNAERRERVTEKEKRKKKEATRKTSDHVCTRARKQKPEFRRVRVFPAYPVPRTRSKYQRNRESGHLREQQLVASRGALFFIIRSHLRFEGIGTEET